MSHKYDTGSIIDLGLQAAFMQKPQYRYNDPIQKQIRVNCISALTTQRKPVICLLDHNVQTYFHPQIIL